MNAKRNNNSVAVSLLAAWQAAPALLARTLNEGAGLAERARAIARLLREWVPGAQAVVCRLGRGESFAQIVEGAAGGEAQRLAVDALDNQRPSVDTTCLLAVGDLRGVSVALQHGLFDWGGLSVVMPARTFEQVGKAILGLMNVTAALVTLQLELGQTKLDAAAADKMTTELVHDLSNSLNTMVLQAALVQVKADESLRQELAVIREVGAQAASRLRASEQAHHERGPKP